MPTLLPDLANAIKKHIADSVDVVAITSTRLYLQWPTGNNKIVVPPFTGQSCILIESGLGGPGPVGSSLIDERVDLRCYGTDRMNAYLLWRTLHAYLFPPNERRTTSFTKDGCRVHTIFHEGGPLRLVDEGMSNWQFCMGSYIFRYSSVVVT